jgi:hypothetical protein
MIKFILQNKKRSYPMHADTFLHNLLASVTHKSRLKMLCRMVKGLINTKRMGLTKLARNLCHDKIQERSAIRNVDRFLGNSFFQEHSPVVFKAITQYAIGNQTRPKIIIDSSKVPGREEGILCASLIATGRSIVLYEAVYPIKDQTSQSIADKVVSIYSLRMTIEESFRDLKSHQYGFGMSQCKVLKQQRIIVWLQLAALASLLAWMVGYFAESQGLQYQFQANSIKNRRVLSLFYLGCQVMRKNIKLAIFPSKITFYEGFDL